jgi:hypothetical protein
MKTKKIIATILFVSITILAAWQFNEGRNKMIENSKKYPEALEYLPGIGVVDMNAIYRDDDRVLFIPVGWIAVSVLFFLYMKES